MIFVTVGSQKFQFNRLLKEIDKLVGEKKITEEIFAQTGYSNYEPKNYKYKNFLDRDEFSNIMSKCDKVITHGGTGAVIGAVKQGKKVIAVPRLTQYGEHIDDHQLQLIEQFTDMNLIFSCMHCSELQNALLLVKDITFSKYISNTESIINNIDRYINEF